MTTVEQQLLEKIYQKRFSQEMSYLTRKTADNMYWIRGFLLTHATAKAVWGEGEPAGETIYDGPEWEITLADGSHKYLPKMNWQYHLQEIALLEDNAQILAYYAKFL